MVLIKKPSMANQIRTRSAIHSATKIAGRYKADPKGWHATISFKNERQTDKRSHETAHVYTGGEEEFELPEVVPTPEKEDTAPRGNGKISWLGDNEDDNSENGYSGYDEHEESPTAFAYAPEDQKEWGMECIFIEQF